MQILTETFGDVVVAHTPDEMNEDSSGLLSNTLKKSIDRGFGKIVLQMDRSEAFDSAGLTALFDLHDELRRRGGDLKVCGLTAVGKKVFEIVRFDRRFQTFDSLIDAVTSFND